MSRIAVVTGANRGIGREVCRQLAERGYRVVLTARREEEGRAAAQALTAGGGQVEFVRLDVAAHDTFPEVVGEIERRFGPIDVLVNNAGVGLDDENDPSVFRAALDPIRQSMEINALGPLALCQLVVPGMIRRGFGRVVNVSTGMAGLTEMNGGYPAYRLSKVALNAVTRIFADEVGESDVKINSVCPGWVRTDMGGPNATRSVEEGARGIVWAATLPSDGPTGGFFRDGTPIPW